jgi:hypothetical protein
MIETIDGSTWMKIPVNPGQLTAVQLRVSEREHLLRHGLSVSCQIHLISTLLPRAEGRHGAAI